jgi:hypothetical protein
MQKISIWIKNLKTKKSLHSQQKTLLICNEIKLLKSSETLAKG